MGETVEQCYARIKAHGLTLKQQSAVDLLVAGNNDVKTAELLSVARTTVSKWRLYDPAFQAALQARRADVWGSSLDQLRSLIPKAIARIAQELDSKLYSYEAAIALMRLIKIPSLVPTGPSSAEQVIEDLTSERMTARRHACMEEVEKLTGLKDRFGTPEQEREHTREDVMGVLAHQVHDVGPSKSDPWETRLERAKAYASQAPTGGNTSEHSVTPAPSEPAQPAAESLTPPAAAPEAASAAPAGSIMPVETQPAAANDDVVAEPPQPADQAAGNRTERTTTPTPAAPATPEPERNREERSATLARQVSNLSHAAELANPAVGYVEEPTVTPVPARPANLAVGNIAEHSATPEPEVARAASTATMTLVPNVPASSVPAGNVTEQLATPPDTGGPGAARDVGERSSTPAAAQAPGSTATGTTASVAAAPPPFSEAGRVAVAALKAIRAELAAKDLRDKL